MGGVLDQYLMRCAWRLLDLGERRRADDVGGAVEGMANLFERRLRVDAWQ